MQPAPRAVAKGRGHVHHRHDILDPRGGFFPKKTSTPSAIISLGDDVSFDTQGRDQRRTDGEHDHGEDDLHSDDPFLGVTSQLDLRDSGTGNNRTFASVANESITGSLNVAGIWKGSGAVSGVGGALDVCALALGPLHIFLAPSSLRL